MTLYAAGKDRALLVSRRFHGGVPRAGDVPETGPLLVHGVDTIDVTASSMDGLGLNHSGYAENNALLNDRARHGQPAAATRSSRKPWTRPSSPRWLGWEDVGQAGVTIPKFNAALYAFNMKNRFREFYADKVDVSHTGTGDPDEPEMSDLEIARRIAFILGEAVEKKRQQEHLQFNA